MLILGLYEFMLNVLHNIWQNINFFIAFIIGAAMGAFVVSRVISFLFRKDRCKTLYALLGLVIGCLSIPIKKIYVSGGPWAVSDFFIMLALLLFGFLLALGVNKFGKRK